MTPAPQPVSAGVPVLHRSTAPRHPSLAFVAPPVVAPQADNAGFCAAHTLYAGIRRLGTVGQGIPQDPSTQLSRRKLWISQNWLVRYRLRSPCHLMGAACCAASSMRPPENQPRPATVVPRKEVIQPHLPVRLPCYDFVPVTNPTLGRCLLAVSPRTSGVAHFHDVTGGVYKARVQIHRRMANRRLLATPPSWGRVAAPNLN